MILNATDGFQVEWRDPADAQVTWLWDQMHCPRPLAPLGADMMDVTMAAVGGRRIVVNGYYYHSVGAPTGAPPAPLQAPPRRDAVELWEQEYLPRVKEICARVRDADYEGMTAARLADSIDGLFAEAGRAFAYTMAVVMHFGLPTSLLVDFCETEFGPSGDVTAMTMLQGFENESTASGGRLGALAELAGANPEVAAAIRDGRFDELDRVPGGDAFLAELRRYLDEYGWRLETWAELHVPTWAENPAVPLKLIRRYLEHPERSPAVALRRAAEQREETIRDTEARLDPDKLPRFRTLLGTAQAHVPVSEGRALWQLISAGVLRIPLLALGRKLVAAGRLERPDDVFFLHVDELKEVAHSAAAVPPRPVVARRRDDLERWGRLIPPRYLGAPPPPGLMGGAPFLTRFFGHGVEVSTDSRIVNGFAASRGVARGRARVVMHLSEAERLEAGDILVCPSTAPPWTPLFAVVVAVVTDSGGVLSHSAICAREYAIPCVVGTQVATQKIADGAFITVDGGQGIVRIEE